MAMFEYRSSPAKAPRCRRTRVLDPASRPSLPVTRFWVPGGSKYYGFRHYDPALGRWLSRDPIGEEDGVNLYWFVRNAVVDRLDLFGELDVDSSKPIRPASINGVAGDLFPAKAGGYNLLQVWRSKRGLPNDYFCHGYTFDTWNKPGGPFSPLGDQVIHILVNDGWKQVCCSKAKGGIIVFRWPGHPPFTHSGKLESVVTDKNGKFLQERSTLSQKHGLEGKGIERSTVLDALRKYRSSDYTCFVKGKPPHIRAASGTKGDNESYIFPTDEECGCQAKDDGGSRAD